MTPIYIIPSSSVHAFALPSMITITLIVSYYKFGRTIRPFLQCKDTQKRQNDQAKRSKVAL